MTDDIALTIEQVAKRLNVSERTVRRLVENGQIKGYSVGRQIRIDPPDLAEFIQRQKQQAIKAL